MNRPTPPTTSKRRALAAVLVLWGCAVAACWRGSAARDLALDEQASAAPVNWPACPGVEHSSASDTVLLFMHPKCPCTQATLEELGHIVDGLTKARPRIEVIVTVPPDAGVAWRETPTVDRAASLPRARVTFDLDGKIAARFGAAASGTIAAYAANGQLIYSGGVTQARGHVGRNVGADALEAALAESRPATRSLPPLGCRLVRASLLGSTSGDCKGETCPASTFKATSIAANN